MAAWLRRTACTSVQMAAKTLGSFAVRFAKDKEPSISMEVVKSYLSGTVSASYFLLASKETAYRFTRGNKLLFIRK